MKGLLVTSQGIQSFDVDFSKRFDFSLQEVPHFNILFN